MSSARTHIFWQRRIRAGDTTTPWWYPSQTTGGSIREDRIVLPIPPGVRWDEAMPVLLPTAGVPGERKARSGEPSAAAGESGESTGSVSRRVAGHARRIDAPPQRPREAKPRIYKRQLDGELRFAPAKRATTELTGRVDAADAPTRTDAATRTDAVRPKRAPRRHDPVLVARARELRDRWLEHVQAHEIATATGKYDVCRTVGPATALPRLAA